jgi:adenine deaminase
MGGKKMDKRLVSVSMGLEKADLAVINGKIVNVYSKEIYDGGVAVANGKIAAVGDVGYCIGENTKIIDAKGKYLLPGFIDGHIHPESTNLSIRGFAEIVLTHGTTVVMSDMHEVGVVGGLEAIEVVLNEAQSTDLKIYFVVPSHVPFAPGLETSGGIFNSEIISAVIDMMRLAICNLVGLVSFKACSSFLVFLLDCDAGALFKFLRNNEVCVLATCFYCISPGEYILLQPNSYKLG